MRNFKAFLRWLIRWSPAVALTAGATYFSTVYGIMAVLWFFFGVLKVILATASIIAVAMIIAIIGCIIATGAAWLWDVVRAWLYE